MASKQPDRRVKIRGYRKRLLLLALAKEDGTSAQIAARFQMSAGAVRQYKMAHRAEIEAIRADIENEFAGMWIAQKAARLAEYMADVERVNDFLDREPLNDDDGDQDDEDGEDDDAKPRVPAPALLRVKHNALKSAAEEMGHLPSRAGIVAEGKTVRVTIEGVDMADLT